LELQLYKINSNSSPLSYKRPALYVSKRVSKREERERVKERERKKEEGRGFEVCV
jgi:hypothetical protein